MAAAIVLETDYLGIHPGGECRSPPVVSCLWRWASGPIRRRRLKLLSTQTINLASLSLLLLITVRRDVVDVVFIAMFSSTLCRARPSWPRVAPCVLGIPPAAPNAVLALPLLLRLLLWWALPRLLLGNRR